MNAAVYHGRRDVRVEVVPEPGDPGAGELLLEVVRASICGTDASEWSHGPIQIPLARPHPASGHRGPVVLGHEFVGKVAAAGEGTTGFATGERVVCGAGVSCGSCAWCRAGRTNLCSSYYTIGLHAHGGLAQLVRTPAAICRAVPERCSDDDAALAQPLAVALHAVRRSEAQAGDCAAVIGVGGIGAFILAAAATRGLTPLIAVDVDAARLETARKLGADVVLDARSSSLAAAIRAASGNEGPDIVIESSGAPQSPAIALESVRRGGRIVQVGLQGAPSQIDLFDATIREVDIVATVAHVCAQDLPEAVTILETTELGSLVIDRVIPLEAVVEEGLRPLAERSARGKIVVDPAV